MKCWTAGKKCQLLMKLRGLCLRNISFGMLLDVYKALYNDHWLLHSLTLLPVMMTNYNICVTRGHIIVSLSRHRLVLGGVVKPSAGGFLKQFNSKQPGQPRQTSAPHSRTSTPNSHLPHLTGALMMARWARVDVRGRFLLSRQEVRGDQSRPAMLRTQQACAFVCSFFFLIW